MAYIDPNTGGMLFQILATAFAVFSGVMLVFSRQIRAAVARVRRFLRDFRGRGEQDERGGRLDSGRAAAESEEH